ncbi:hypothetical protein DYB25_003072 [Aphanomyces astaci]|uniref:RNase H type-1 domain-containing protein n=1 Tax=Aphanomyces astaci TaxID=112090 RepID=A0A397B787_APHAT|nr:hypothetical protein DYB25_003072 [Aphanomyces astaci]
MEGMVFFDGAARLDPACGGSGALVLAREFPLLCDYDAHYLPMATTNNQAEYDGLVRGLTLARTQGQPKIKRAPGEGEGTERRGRKPNPYRSQVTMFLLNNKNANPNDCYQWLLQNYVNPDLPQPDLKQIKTLINNIKSNPNFRSQAMY